MKKVCGVIAAISFLMLIGFVGGMDQGTLTLAQGGVGAFLSVGVFAVSLKIGGVIN